MAEDHADELGRALFTAKVAATGKLADPTDLDYNGDLINDVEGLNAAIDTLIEAKPHTKARKLSGDAGQGYRGDKTAPTDFSSLLR